MDRLNIIVATATFIIAGFLLSGCDSGVSFIDSPTPTPQLFSCEVGNKTVYTNTVDDCSSLQKTQQENQNNNDLPPCSLFGPNGPPAPCVNGL
jgi:hypothetical protein